MYSLAFTVLATTSSLLISSSTAGVPQFVNTCLNGVSKGGKLIQVYCTSRQDFGEVVINNSSGATTVISNCQFNGCGNIHAKTPVMFTNVVFNHSAYGGVNSFASGGAGGAVIVDNTAATFKNVTFLNCKAK